MAGKPQLTVPVAGRADGDTAAPIEIRGVRQTFGEVVALDGIDLSIPATRLGIVGPGGTIDSPVRHRRPARAG